MGAYLSEPITEKHSSDYEGVNLKCGASSMQGWRVSQEVSNLIGLYSCITLCQQEQLIAIFSEYFSVIVCLAMRNTSNLK